MPLQGYGLLIGHVSASRPPRKGSPHWLLFVQPGDPKHPPYRVAVNFQLTAHGKPAESQYQIVKRFPVTGPAAKLMRAIRGLGSPKAFLTADSAANVPRLDFARDRFLNPKKFSDLHAGEVAAELERAFNAAVREASKSGGDMKVAVFGTGAPIDKDTGQPPPTGFTGVENIHMNQGSLNLINHPPHYRENATGQDGGIVFYTPDSARGFFVKFATQTLDTRDDGHPAITGVPGIDMVTAKVRKAIMPPMPKPRDGYMAMAATTKKKKAKTPKKKSGGSPAPKPGSTNTSGFVFADVDPQDATGQWIPDKDDNYETPFVQTIGKGKVKGPVPAPRSYPTMLLSTVVGDDPPGYSKSGSAETITFDIIGDSGGPKSPKLEQGVADLMSVYAQKVPPAFLFHVGDVVYYYGEENYYYSQFYEPFRAYPAPIFAIPGNHDGITYNAAQVSLDSFQKAFCATTPQAWEGCGGIRRTAMTQPGVYFTLDAPLVSIIGLYSNCGESFGYLDAPQYQFLYQELVRLKAARAQEFRAVILAIHHFPRWFPNQSKKDPTGIALDATFAKAGLWPDAVICGHAHLYQRVVRPNGTQQIPYIMSGAGGYGIQPAEELGKDYMKNTVGSNTKLGKVLFEGGFVRATLVKPSSGDPTITFDYHSVKQTSAQPDDSCVLNLNTHKVV